MYFVFFNSRKLQPAIAYKHTCNDEPCYDEHCENCYGDLANPIDAKGEDQ